MAESKIAAFRRIVWAHYKKHGRHDLPWRLKTNSTLYRVLVSEMMLQQTQVDRVIPFYKKFLKQFPTARRLAEAPLSDVLKSWQGLGYNRRAKLLHQAAKLLAVTRFDLKNNAPRSNLVTRLEELPGVGPYTARAVAAFAWNEDVIVIETNIRTAVIHHFFTNKKKVSDAAIETLLVRALPKGKAREWYSALMDYGAYLKQSGISYNTHTAGYTKQKRFSGSLREARGSIVRSLALGHRDARVFCGLLGAQRRSQMKEALAALRIEGLVKKEGPRYFLAS